MRTWIARSKLSSPHVGRDASKSILHWEFRRDFEGNQKTGDIAHPAIVYVIGPNGRITFVVNGNANTISAAVRAL